MSVFCQGTLMLAGHCTRAALGRCRAGLGCGVRPLPPSSVAFGTRTHSSIRHRRARRCPTGVLSWAQEGSFNLSENEAAQLLAAVDLDGDGHISFDNW